MERKTKNPITIVGLDRAGKSVITNYLATGILVRQIRPTLSLNYASIILNNLKCPFYDTPGQKSLRSTWGKILDMASFIIFTIDTADHERYIESMNELIPILQKESLKRIPILVLFHKIDLPKAKEHLEELKIYFSPDFIQSYGTREVAYFETTIEDIKTLDAVRDYLGNHIAELTQAAGFCEDIIV